MPREIQCDVLVVGGGNAALCAAITAAEQGAGVVVIERAEPAWRGGNSKYTRNVRCARISPDPELHYSFEEFADDLAGVTGEGSSAELTALVIEESEGVPAWMSERGVRWQPALTGTLSLARTNHFFLGGGKALINVYYHRAEELGIAIHYGCSAEGFEIDGSRCNAVLARDAEGDLRFRPEAVVVASAGFEANHEWLAEYWGEAANNIYVRGARQNDGLPLQLLRDAGAKLTGNPKGFHAIAVDGRGPRFEGGIATRVDSIPFGVMVNRDGVRFADEGEDIWPKRYAVWGKRILEQPGQIGFSVFDRKVLGRFMTTAYPAYEAGSVAGLAGMIEVDPAALEQTLDDYNAAVVPAVYDTAVLDDCRTEGLAIAKSHWALPIDEPPFYAYPLRPGITFTYLGLKVDAEARVLREDESGFDNLFAAGEIVAGNILLRGYLAGFGMTIGTVFGRLAGRSAAGG